MTDALTDALEAKVAEVAAIENPVERGLAAREVRDQLAENDRALYAIQRDSVRKLRPEHTWAEIGELFGRSYGWAEALAAGRGSRRRKNDHAAESTPRADAPEGHSPDADQPDQ